MGTYINYLKKFEKPINIKKGGLVITVTGLSGSGKSTVAEAIAKAFKLKLFSAGDIERKFACQRKISIYTASTIRPKKLDYEMDKKILKLALKGKCVLLGRLSAWSAGDWADCKVFIDCRKEIRAKRVARRDYLTIREALLKVNERDTADYKQYKKLYGIDVNKKDIFDLIINNNRVGLKKIKQETVKKIKKFLNKNL